MGGHLRCTATAGCQRILPISAYRQHPCASAVPVTDFGHEPAPQWGVPWDHDSDPIEWTSLATTPKYTDATKNNRDRSLESPSGGTIRRSLDPTPSERRMLERFPGRSIKSRGLTMAHSTRPLRRCLAHWSATDGTLRTGGRRPTHPKASKSGPRRRMRAVCRHSDYNRGGFDLGPPGGPVLCTDQWEASCVLLDENS